MTVTIAFHPACGTSRNTNQDSPVIEDSMMAHRIFINRPIVVTPLVVNSCRPSGAVPDILSNLQRGTFSKEDGKAIVGTNGNPVPRPAA